MSIRDANQRWLASEGLDNASIARRNAALGIIVNRPSDEALMGYSRPPWWRPFARRRWARTVLLAMTLYAETASRMGVIVGPPEAP